MLKAKILQAATNSGQTYVDDVFSTYLYTGNGSTQTINNGIDLAGKGGLIWIKDQVNATSHALFDTSRGVNLGLTSNDTSGSSILVGSLTSFNSSGFSLGSQNAVNNATGGFASWTFRKAPKFFDVVTYTGTGANRTVAHSLGQVPGMIISKRTDTIGDWQVYHRSLANTAYLVLNTTAASATSATRWNSTTPTESVFSLGADATVNASGGTYVAYLFAHDTSAEGLIQCGSFTTDGSGNASVNLGWEPQFVMVKQTSTTDSWQIHDTMRGASLTTYARLLPDLSSAEQTGSVGAVAPTATGFTTALGVSSTYIYLAIRRPNKPPTTGTQVYNAIARTGTGAAATVTGVGFAPDLTLSQQRSAVQGGAWYDRMRGATKVIAPTSTGAEGTNAQGVTGFDVMDGFRLGTEGSVNATVSLIHHFLRRASGFMDEVCYTGTGAVRTVAHNLTVVPELMIFKSRSFGSGWIIYSPVGNASKALDFSNGALADNATYLNGVSPTSSVFTLGGDGGGTNNSAETYVSYLFASLPGISKVGTYTGNGSSQTINCGFTTGARFILIKRTDSTGDWYVWDSARGIVSGNDPHLSLNTTAAEVTTDDSVDPDNSGFIVNQLAATNINVNLATYIFLAVA